MSNITELKNIPDVSFIDNLSQEDIYQLLKSKYVENYVNLTGQEPILYDTSSMTLLMQSIAFIISQGFQYVNRSGKQDLLKYSYGSYLDNLAALRGVTRKQATVSTTIIEFTLSATMPQTISIPKGTKLKSKSKELFFLTSDYLEIKPGAISGLVHAVCLIPGIAGNDLPIGDINQIIDTTNTAYIASVKNTTITSGGSDIESDDDLTRRVYEISAAYSVAGPIGAYEYHTRAARSDIANVVVTSPKACEVEIYVMLKNNVIPEQSILEEIKNYLNDEKIRPLTDKVSVLAPTQITYDLKLTYYINNSDASQSITIQNKVKKTINEYISWQSYLGRDINPSELTCMMLNAGVKRVVITSPSFKKIEQTQVAMINSNFNYDKNIIYGGLESE